MNCELQQGSRWPAGNTWCRRGANPCGGRKSPHGKGNGWGKPAAACPLQGYRPYLKGRASPINRGLAQRVLLGREKRITGTNLRVVSGPRGAYQKQRALSSEKPLSLITPFRWTAEASHGQSAAPVVAWRKSDDERLATIGAHGRLRRVLCWNGNTVGQLAAITNVIESFHGRTSPNFSRTPARALCCNGSYRLSP
ncbi:hypothetical protein SDC9_160774 [bioreactor metagenome]|uniref:Uncharacterized protein n=1 Tax=bioreactor metagenome TaxID=1076179 RepID=A0A645FMN1_9ZZZZ